MRNCQREWRQSPCRCGRTRGTQSAWPRAVCHGGVTERVPIADEYVVLGQRCRGALFGMLGRVHGKPAVTFEDRLQLRSRLPPVVVVLAAEDQHARLSAAAPCPVSSPKINAKPTSGFPIIARILLHQRLPAAKAGERVRWAPVCRTDIPVRPGRPGMTDLRLGCLGGLIVRCPCCAGSRLPAGRLEAATATAKAGVRDVAAGRLRDC